MNKSIHFLYKWNPRVKEGFVLHWLKEISLNNKGSFCKWWVKEFPLKFKRKSCEETCFLLWKAFPSNFQDVALNMISSMKKRRHFLYKRKPRVRSGFVLHWDEEISLTNKGCFCKWSENPAKWHVFSFERLFHQIWRIWLQTLKIASMNKRRHFLTRESPWQGQVLSALRRGDFFN